jgi:hypothetical protein
MSESPYSMIAFEPNCKILSLLFNLKASPMALKSSLLLRSCFVNRTKMKSSSAIARSFCWTMFHGIIACHQYKRIV